MKIEHLYEENVDSKAIKTFIQRGMRGRGQLFLNKAKSLPSTLSNKIGIDNTITSIEDVIGETWNSDQEKLYRLLRRAIINNNIGVLIGRSQSDVTEFSEGEISRLRIWYMAHKDLASEETAMKSLWSNILLAFLNGLGVALGVRRVITTLGVSGSVQTAVTLQQFIFHLNTIFKKIYNGKNLKNALRLIDTAITKHKSST